MMILKETIWAGRRWVEVALFLFVVGLLLGLTVAQTDPEEVLRALQPVLSQIGGIGEQVTAADSPWARAWIIFQRNAQVTLFMTALALPLAGVMAGVAKRAAPPDGAPHYTRCDGGSQSIPWRRRL